MRTAKLYKEKNATLKKQVEDYEKPEYKRGVNIQLMLSRHWYTVGTISECHARGREHPSLSSRSIKLPVFDSEIQSECF